MILYNTGTTTYQYHSTEEEYLWHASWILCECGPDVGSGAGMARTLTYHLCIKHDYLYNCPTQWGGRRLTLDIDNGDADAPIIVPLKWLAPCPCVRAHVPGFRCPVHTRASLLTPQPFYSIPTPLSCTIRH